MSGRSNPGEPDAHAPDAVIQELRAWCEERGTSQSALAMEIGVSVSHLNQVINGRARPSAELARRIVEVLKRRKARGATQGHAV